MRPRGSFGFGLARSLDFHTSLASFTELCELLSASVEHVFYPHHALSYAELSVGLERGELGLGWTPPIPAIDLQDRNAASLLVAPVRKGSTLYHAAMIVRPGSFKTLGELKGKRAGWVDRDSAAGYVVPRLHLAANGFDPAGFFAQEIFLGSHIAVVEAVVSGRVDVGGTFCKVESHTGRVSSGAWTTPDGKNPKRVEALATIGPIPNDVIVASNKLAPELRARIFRWFLDPEPRALEILAELVRADSCRAPTPSHYEPLRKMIAAGRRHGEMPWRKNTTRPPA
jgi:phosphonate transport system substrate-binding protein